MLVCGCYSSNFSFGLFIFQHATVVYWYVLSSWEGGRKTETVNQSVLFLFFCRHRLISNKILSIQISSSPSLMFLYSAEFVDGWHFSVLSYGENKRAQRNQMHIIRLLIGLQYWSICLFLTSLLQREKIFHFSLNYVKRKANLIGRIDSLKFDWVNQRQHRSKRKEREILFGRFSIN